MSDYVQLIGGEKVERAASNIASASETFSRAVQQLDDAMTRQQNFMNEWLERFESALRERQSKAEDRG